MTHISDLSTPPTYPDYDPYDPTIPAVQVRQQYAAMRGLCPITHIPRHGGFDAVTHFDEAREIAADHRRFSSADGSFIRPPGWPPIPPLDFDEPEHRRWVKLMQEPLTLAAVRKFEPTIREIVDDHIDRFAAHGRAELYEQFAEPIPVQVVGRLVGLSTDAATAMRHVAMNAFAAIGTDDFPRRWREFMDFTDAELQHRREKPTGDYLSQLASGEFNGETIDDSGSAGILNALLVGGHHSTASALAGLFNHVITAPGLRERLSAQPALLDNVVEESLRLTTPLQYFVRTATTDAQISGCPIPQGRRVMLNFGAANRDERAFPDPNHFNPDREHHHHLAFGHGIHLCIGRYLARAELRIALQRLLERLPDIEPDGEPVEPGYVGTIMFSITHLPVRFSPPGS